MLKLLIIYIFFLLNSVFFKNSKYNKKEFINKNLNLNYNGKFLFINSFLLDDFFYKKNITIHFRKFLINKIKLNRILKEVIVA